MRSRRKACKVLSIGVVLPIEVEGQVAGCASWRNQLDLYSAVLDFAGIRDGCAKSLYLRRCRRCVGSGAHGDSGRFSWIAGRRRYGDGDLRFAIDIHGGNRNHAIIRRCDVDRGHGTSRGCLVRRGEAGSLDDDVAVGFSGKPSAGLYLGDVWNVAFHDLHRHSGFGHAAIIAIPYP